jgi:hypothetical protein
VIEQRGLLPCQTHDDSWMDFYEILFEGQPMTGKIWSQLLQDQSTTLISLKLAQKIIPGQINKDIPAGFTRHTPFGDDKSGVDSRTTYPQGVEQSLTAPVSAGTPPSLPSHHPSSSFRAGPLAPYGLQLNVGQVSHPANPNIPTEPSRYHTPQPSDLTATPYTTSVFTLIPAIQNIWKIWTLLIRVL